jgi:hypothetical protein
VVDSAGQVWDIGAGDSGTNLQLRWLGDAWVVIQNVSRSSEYLIDIQLIAPDEMTGWKRIYTSFDAARGQNGQMWSMMPPIITFENGYQRLTVIRIPYGKTEQVITELKWRDGAYVFVDESPYQP